MSDQFSQYDAAYVLGALSPTERREFEAHLPTCESCARAVRQLAGLPGLMARVSLDEVLTAAEPPPDTLLPALSRAVRQERARRRWLAGVAAAVVLGLGGAGAGLAASLANGGSNTAKATNPSATTPGATAPSPTTDSRSTTDSGGSVVTMTALSSSTPVHATSRLVDRAWGTRVDLTCTYAAGTEYPPGGAPYALFVIDREGRSQQVAVWKALPDRVAKVMGASSWARADIASVEIRTLSGKPVLRAAN